MSTRMKSYMAGDTVQRDDQESKLRWIQDLAILPVVPVDIACTGPKTIRDGR